MHGKEQARLALEPGASQQAHVQLGQANGQQDQPAWFNWVRTPVQLTFSAADEFLAEKVEVERSVITREPLYLVQRLPAPQIDGRLAEWDGVAAMRLDSSSTTILSRGGYAGEKDLQATVRLAWSPGYLHLGVEVRDDALVDDGKSAIWDNDSIEIYFDGRAEEARDGSYGDWVSQNILPVLRESEEVFVGISGWRADAIEWKVQRGDFGYVLEASIPFQLLTGKDELRKGDSVRFDFMINDRDGERKEYSRHPLWTRVNTWKNTSEFGRMVLD